MAAKKELENKAKNADEAEGTKSGESPVNQPQRGSS